MSETTGREVEADRLVISVRAFAESKAAKGARHAKSTKAPPKNRKYSKPSPWTLFFDTETRTDPGQAFRFGCYQVCNADQLIEAGIFYDPITTTAPEFIIMRDFASANGLRLIMLEAFVDEVFYPYGYDRRGTIVGFNLPFDISRSAFAHASARGTMRGGFSFRLSKDKRRPAVQIMHLSRKSSLIRFTAPFRQYNSRSERRRGKRPVRRGFFVDVHTFAGALFARSFSLRKLADLLGVKSRKLSADEHGGPITPEYLRYAVRDVETTRECYEELVRRYDRLELRDTYPPQIFSEASIGKGYLRAMGIKPFREQQDVPPAVLAKILGSYYGGRSEVRIRRELRQVVLCDFTSMYPTVCTLMGLWRYVTADGMTWRDGTEEVRRFLETITLTGLQDPKAWRYLTALARLEPDMDVLPVRAPYGEQRQATIGANHLKSDQPMWFTVADCVLSKILNDRAPKITEAIIFEPGTPQSGLQPIIVAGAKIDPLEDDFYKSLIEARDDVKRRREKATGKKRDVLDAQQNAIKIAANATSYGIFIEINVQERAERNRMAVHSSVERSYLVETEKDETPGRFFHPLLATLITGAARLMLAITERRVTDRDLEWSFCDTDSMAIARPANIPEADFYAAVDEVTGWFAKLNPYRFGGSILRVEDVNFSLTTSDRREPLFCWAISAKRYALFNLDSKRRPILRKASAHGLGAFRAAYDAKTPARGIRKPSAALEKIGVELWQHDLWWKIISAALTDNPDRIDLDYHPALNQPAVSRYAATTPKQLSWFARYNDNRPYPESVKPFGFLYVLHADSLAESGETLLAEHPNKSRRSRSLAKPVAPFDQDLAKAVANCFDRETGLHVSKEKLQTYRQAIALYHLHPESKFHNGNYLDRGTTQRRHVHVTAIRNIGKEANEWEAQFYLGFDEDERIDYGLASRGAKADGLRLRKIIKEIGLRRVARESGVARRTVERLMKGKTLRSRPLARIIRALKAQ